MANRIVVDPITRIEGHLRIEVEVKDGVITDAFSSSPMVRGLENIVKAGTHGMFGLLFSAPVGFVPRFTHWHRFARWKIL